MESESVIDMMKIGLEYIMISLFLLASVQCVLVRNRYANSLNEKYESRLELRNRLEFSRFKTGLNQNDITECVTADVVLETIRNYKDGSITIYVDHVKYGGSLLLNDTTAITNADSFSIDSLMDMIDFSTYYHPYLIYDNNDVIGPYQVSGTEITGIAFIQFI